MTDTMNSTVHLMQKEQDPLNLGSLPLIEPPTDGWPLIEQAMRKRQNQRRLWMTAGAAVAVAASLMITFNLVLQQDGQFIPDSGSDSQNGIAPWLTLSVHGWTPAAGRIFSQLAKGCLAVSAIGRHGPSRESATYAL